MVAIIPVFNEADVLGSAIRRLASSGAEAYVIDNWSTDGSYELARDLVEGPVVGVERFPPEGATGRHEWDRMLDRIAEVGATLDADWVMHHDADELRQPPWPGVDWRRALWAVQQDGFNCIDHTVLVFPPTRGPSLPGADFVDAMRYFEFGQRPGHFLQRKGWRAGQAVDLSSTGGHDVSFPGRRVYPFKFLLRHYPIRSQAHGEQKVFGERLPRYDPRLRRRGWHTQYDGLQPGHRFVRPRRELTRFDERTFWSDYLLERLSGLAIRPGDLEDGG